MDTIGLVSSQSVTMYWYVVRGSGFVVFILLSLGVVLGLLMSLRWRSHAWPRIITEELHRYVMLVAGIFLALHIGSTLLDSYVHFELYQVFVPFTSSYRVIWMSAGIVAMYLAMALYASIYLRRFIGYRLWRALHYGGFFAWVLALVHGITTGTDTRARWALAIYGGSALIVALLLAARAGGLPLRIGRPAPWRPRVVAALGAALLLGALLVEIGPLQRGWAAHAGGAITPPVTMAAAASPPPSAFQDTMSGTADVQNPGGLQQGTELLHLQLHGDGSFPVTASYGILLAGGFGGAQFIRGVFSLAPRSLGWTCSGAVSFQPPDAFASTCSPPAGPALHVVTTFTIDQSGSVSGQVSASAAAGNGSNGQST
jgi:sulfoxide reductase heme-binding subunit YedZ